MIHSAPLRILLLLGCLASTAAAQVVINEVHYSPVNRTVPEEFIELYNNGGPAVDLSGWYFSEGVSYTFPAVTLEPGAYLVVAQDPATLTARYGALEVVGPFDGRLDSDGETITLRNSQGEIQDQVDYRMSFPWPTMARVDNLSMELIHPDLDNDLGGSWRVSNPGIIETNSLVRSGDLWRYRKGTTEASSPVTAWRTPGFNDTGWLTGRASIGYGEDFITTTLDDMRGNYSSVFLRKTFEVDDASTIAGLTLEVLCDDGFNAWINGVHVAGNNVPSEEMPYDGTANSALEDLDFNPYPLPWPVTDYLVSGTNVLAIQLHNANISSSSDAFIDAILSTGGGSGAGPTPGRVNSVFATNTPPHMRQVNHSPETPFGGQGVFVTVKVTDDDGVAEVTLDYQLVDPGAYIRRSDPAYETQWTTVSMHDDATQGDQLPGDSIYSVIMPGTLQTHRRLVRYRITARDTTGLSITGPYPDDTQPNFAYFVYDGVPAWEGSVRPGVEPVRVYDSELLESIPVYHLLTRRQDHLNAMHVPYRWGQSGQMVPTVGEYGGSDYRWEGTLVYDGKVYDHIRYRARGGVWRYSMGKNMWKFDFNRGHYFEARDDHGRRYDTTWDKLNFSALIQQGNFLQRGEQGLFEGPGFKLHDLAGNHGCKAHYVHYRIVADSDEEGPDQYSGDFQGLYQVLEQMDGRFLDEHGLPDGNLYKMEGGSGELNNQGPTQPTNKSDLNTFMNTYRNSSPSAAWWEQNLDLPDYYDFRAMAMAIHDYDIHAGKNYFYFHNPDTDKWNVYNWDLDLCWTTTYNGGGGRGPLNQYVLDPFPQFQLQYANRARELCDLLFNEDQTGMLLRETAGVVHTPGELSFVDADRAMWDYNPILVSSYINSSKAGHGKYYEAASPRTFAGMLNKEVNYVRSRHAWMLSTQARDLAIPATPVVTSVGPPDFPVDELHFHASAFDDPQGAGTFGAMKWRAAEVTPPGSPDFIKGEPRLFEIDAAWESAELESFTEEIQIPAGALKIGSTYRVRVRMMDHTGRWSHWSDPVEFVVGEPTEPFPQQASLRVTEVMYHPQDDGELEFIEILNTGPTSLDLRSVSLVDGIEFHFADGDVTLIFPGEYVVVVSNRRLFESRYDTTGIRIAGEYEGRLSNGGERVVLTYGSNATILDFFYDDLWYPLTDGGGHSLVIVDPYGPTSAWSEQAGWIESEFSGGSPGMGDGPPPTGGFQLPGDANQDGFLDISDGLALLLHLFGGASGPLPCEGSLSSGSGNEALLNVDGEGSVDLTDAVYILNYLFREGPAPALGVRCVRIEGCPSVCRF